jgi:hypothetical protein
MKYIFKSAFTIVIALTVTISGCKKETPVKTKKELICSGNWTQKSFTINPGIDIGGIVITDFFTQFDACSKDDFEKYETSGLGASNEGATKCDPSDPQTTAFTWSFKNSETVLTKDAEDADIVTLNENEMILSLVADGADVGGTPGIKYKLTVGYKH